MNHGGVHFGGTFIGSCRSALLYLYGGVPGEREGQTCAVVYVTGSATCVVSGPPLLSLRRRRCPGYGSLKCRLDAPATCPAPSDSGLRPLADAAAALAGSCSSPCGALRLRRGEGQVAQQQRGRSATPHPRCVRLARTREEEEEQQQQQPCKVGAAQSGSTGWLPRLLGRESQAPERQALAPCAWRPLLAPPPQGTFPAPSGCFARHASLLPPPPLTCCISLLPTCRARSSPVPSSSRCNSLQVEASPPALPGLLACLRPSLLRAPIAPSRSRSPAPEVRRRSRWVERTLEVRGMLAAYPKPPDSTQGGSPALPSSTQASGIKRRRKVYTRRQRDAQLCSGLGQVQPWPWFSR